MKKDSRHMDALTNFYVYAYGKGRIEDVLKQGAGKDTAFLIEFENWEKFCDIAGQKAADYSLAKLSFFLTKCFHKTDLFIRIAPAAFFIYSFGYMEEADICRMLQQLRCNMQTTASLQMCQKECPLHIGISHVRNAEQFAQLFAQCEHALSCAIEQGVDYCIAGEGEMDLRISDSRFPMAIPPYQPDYQDIDIHFVIDMTNFLHSGMDLHFGVEMVLSCMCEYFSTQQIYIMEKDFEEEGYAVIYEWLRQGKQVENANFKRLSLSIGDAHQHLFDEQNLLVCAQQSDMYKYDVMMALRESIRGAQALLQSAIYDHGTYVGYLCMMDCVQERVWTAKETATFSILAKIIATVVLQLRSQRISEQMLSHDYLTNAMNLRSFVQTVERRMLRDTHAQMAIVTLDIKNFKYINAEHGYAYGNTILISIAQILKLFLDAQECFARSDGDNFVLQLYFQNREQFVLRISSLLQKIERCTVQFHPMATVICKAGIYVMEHSDKSVSEMLDGANLARKSIKDSHKSTYAFFNKELEVQSIREHTLSQLMKQALQKEEFLVYYQPKVNIHTQTCVGLEALIRWKRKEELIQPGDFIPLFEKNGFIKELDMYVLEKVCQQLQRWFQKGETLFPIAVNLSRIHLEEDSDIVFHMVNLCNRYHIPRHWIELEITETAFLENEANAVQKARELKQAGFLLSMDDFGTGFSSLNLLTELPVDSLKLDRAFFVKESSQREKIILSNIIHMAQQLDMQVISEGIETVQQISLLKEIGCEIAQGYYYAKPCPLEELQARLNTSFAKKGSQNV